MFEIAFLYIVLFVFGACIGSFLNVVIDRLPHGRSIWKGRSVCDSCHKKLLPLELIPILSFIIQFGKCKSCKGKIPVRVLFVEIITGLIFALSVLYFPLDISLVYFLIIASLCISIFFIDLENGIIPNSLNGWFFVIVILYTTLFSSNMFLSHVLASFGTGLFFLSLFLFTKGKGMGFGDVKYAFVMGFFLGFPKTLVALYIAFLTGALVSLILILYGKKKLKATIPFGPFLAFSTITSYVWGQQIVSYVLTKFF